MIRIFAIVNLLSLSLCAGQSNEWPVGPYTIIEYNGESVSLLSSESFQGELDGFYDLGENRIIRISNDGIFNADYIKLYPDSERAIIINSALVPNSDSSIYKIFLITIQSNLKGRLEILEYNKENNAVKQTAQVQIEEVELSKELLVIPHKCGGYWVIVHSFLGSKFYAYRVFSDLMVEDNPVISETGISHSDIHQQNGSFDMNYSSQSNLISLDYNNFTDVFDMSIEIFGFDTYTGQINKHFSIPYRDYHYGRTDFSENGQFLYSYEHSLFDSRIVQYELYSLDSLSTVNSAFVLDERTNFTQSDIKRGPDEKIYIIHDNSIISVINMPNLKGSGSNFEYGVYQSERSIFTQLPDHKMPVMNGDIVESIIDLGEDSTVCSSDLSLSLLDLPDGLLSVNKSLIEDRMTVPVTLGYNDLSITDDLCVFIDSIYISLDEPGEVLPNDTTLCIGDTISISISNYEDIEWSDGLQSNNRSFISTGIFFINFKTSKSCLFSDTINILESTDCTTTGIIGLDCNTYLPQCYLSQQYARE